jgi:AcrR family transcriptional regulator
MAGTQTRPYRMQARAAAAEATRARIVDAALELFIERRYDEVTLREISNAAGVALQTVVNHFDTKENVFVAAIARFGAQVEELRGAAAPGDIRAAAAVLVQDYERAGEANLRLVALEDSVPAVADALAKGRGLHRNWVERTFPGALAGLRGTARRRRLAQLCTVCDALTWKLLRRDHGLTPAQTATALEELLEALHQHPTENPRRNDHE